MKKFQFRLQKLLDIREAFEKQIKNELAAVIGRQNIERAKRDDLLSGIDAEKKIYSERIRRGIFSANEAMIFERFIDSSRRGVVSTEKNIEAIEPDVAEVRQRLLIASRDRKVVEKLKERRFDEFNYEYNKNESKENDDLNQKLFARRVSLEAVND